MSSNSSMNLNFNSEYVISVIIVIVTCTLLMRSSPEMSTFIIVIAGLFVGFISLYLMNNLFPFVNKQATGIYNYYTYQMMNNFNSMGYMHVWPPILAILVIFIILLYNRHLG